jgi:hypothetical protein
MASSNETRVRVEGRSKIIASARPSSRRRTVFLRFFFISRALSMISRNCRRGMTFRSRKCRTALIGPPQSSAGLSATGATSLAGPFKPGDAFHNFLLAHNQRRQQPHDVIAGGDRDHFLRAQRVDEFARRHDRPQADQQTFAADLGYDRRIAVLDFGEALLEQQRRAPYPLEKAGREHDIEHGVGRAHGQRIAAEGRAVSARRHAPRRFGRRQARAHREPAAERLGERHDVRLDAGPLVGE